MAWKFLREHVCPKDRRTARKFEEFVPYYDVKHQLAGEFRPKRILEIGVRAGYSALAFLSACPKATYLGLDAENGKHGGQGGPWTWWAEKLLAPFRATIRICDTQKMSQLDEADGAFDFVHVDGDHSYRGALHDMRMCYPRLATGGVMVVDDYDYLPDVRRAIDDFLRKNPPSCDPRRKFVFQHRESLRGEMLIIPQPFA
jgi:predicted O-methyltransferase YrrM